MLKPRVRHPRETVPSSLKILYTYPIPHLCHHNRLGFTTLTASQGKRNCNTELLHRPRSIGTATCYRPNSRCSIPGSGKIFSSPQPPDRLCGQLNPISNGYQGHFPWGNVAGA
jgi:hypothetical protein